MRIAQLERAGPGGSVRADTVYRAIALRFVGASVGRLFAATPGVVRRTLRSGLFALLLAAHTAAAAQRPEELPALTLEQLLNTPVVTVTRTSESAANAPGHVEVVTAAQIRRRAYRSLADLLRDLSGIKLDLAVDQDLFADITVQGARGASRLVILLDGVRVSSPTNEPLPILANFPVHNARQVEVVYGPGSALYGADAFSGVINIISRDADDADALRVATEVGTGGLSNSQLSYAARIGERGRVTLAAQWLYDGGFDLSRQYPEDFGTLASHRTGTFQTIFGPMNAGMPVSAEYHVPLQASSLYAAAEIGPWTAWVFASRVKTSNAPAYTPDNAVYNDVAFAKNEMLVGAVRHRAEAGPATFTTTIVTSRHELDPDSGYVNVYSNMQRSYKYAYGSMWRGEHQATWKASESLVLTAGASYERLLAIPQAADLNAPLASRTRPGTILGTTIVDALNRLRYSNTGAYVQGQWSGGRWLSVTAGARVDASTRHEGVFNPRVGLVSRVASRTTLKGMYGTAFLAPSPYQAYLHYGSFYSLDGGTTYQSDFWHVPNSDLKPQRKKTVEMQLQHVLARDWTVGISGFHSWLSDLVLEADITSRVAGMYLGWPVAVVAHPVNVGRERLYGATTSIEQFRVFGSDRQLHVRGAYSVAEGRVRAPDAPGGWIESGGLAAHMVQATADLDWRQWGLSSRLLAVSDQRALALAAGGDERPRRRTVDGYTTVDVVGRYREALGPLDLLVNIENVFDVRYRHVNLRAFSNPEELAGSPQNPRRISIGAELHWPDR